MVRRADGRRIRRGNTLRGSWLVTLAGGMLLAGIAAARAAEVPDGARTAQLAPAGAPGVVTAVALDRLAPERAIAVTPFADDELSRNIKQRFEETLREDRRKVAPDATVTLSFETRVIRGRFTSGPGDLGRFEARDGDLRLDLNVWSSTRDSLLGGRQQEAPPREANLFHMNAVVRDRVSGKTLWQGDAYCEMLISDAGRIGLSMVGPMVANLGKSVQRQPFDIE